MSEEEVVKDGYNRIARTYLIERKKLKTQKYVEQLVSHLLPQATILDVGCGAGVSVDDQLLKKGFGIIGIDISSEQIRLARKMCKGGDYQVRDMRDLKRGEYQVEAVVCLFAMFHIPRVEHQTMIENFVSYLPKGGYLLITMGDKEFEGRHEMMGVEMWSSQWGREKNRCMIEELGLKIIVDELSRSANECHQVILAQKV